MPVIKSEDVKREDLWPGIYRYHPLDANVPTGSISMGILTLEPHSVMPCHSHLVDDNMIVLEGEGIARIDGVDYHVKKGDAGFVPAYAHHYLRNESDKDFTVVYVWPSRNTERYFHPEDDHKDPV